MTNTLRQQTLSALIWSFLQNWGTKFFSLLTFLILARLLTPEEMGVASSVSLVLMFVAVLSEQGMIEAIIQQQGLIARHLNLPFLLSMAIAAVCSLCLLFFGGFIAEIVGVKAPASLITMAAIVPPITAATNFQTAIRRRELDFRSLAIATLIATLLAGIVAVGMAFAGFGALSLVAQAICLAVVSAALLWRQPQWKPSFDFDLVGFGNLMAYSSHTFIGKLIDLISSRVIDLAMLSKFGVVGLGMYTVASKLYLTLFQLFASTLMDVALSAFSKLTGQANRLSETYQRFVFLAACTTLPLFFMIGAIAPEICIVLFGTKWDGVGKILQMLAILGAAETVSCFNASLLAANGKAKQLLRINIAKFFLGVSSIVLCSGDSMASITLVFVVSQLAVMPFVFFMAARAGKIQISVTTQSLLPGSLSAALAFSAVEGARSLIHLPEHWVTARGLILATIFCFVFATCLSVTSLDRVRSEVQYLRGSLNKQPRRRHS